MTHLFRRPGLTNAETSKVLALAASTFAGHDLKLVSASSEFCFNLQLVESKKFLELPEGDRAVVQWLLAETFEPSNFSQSSFLSADHAGLPVVDGKRAVIVEFGPRLNFSTAWSANAATIILQCGIKSVKRIERSRRLLLQLEGKDINAFDALKSKFFGELHDKMTECIYEVPLESFDLNVVSECWATVPILEEGKAALEKLNKEMGLALDEWDIEYYTNLFTDKVKRNPTTVELFDISQSNSEHSRHWFFRGRIVIDGEEKKDTLFHLVQDTLKAHTTNSVIAFKDNSSSIRGYTVKQLIPSDPAEPSTLKVNEVDYDVTFTAETHNFPTGIAPFPGAETGTGGRIRDGHATGRGSLVVAGTTGYSVGNLNIPGYELPWENKEWNYPRKYATPLHIEIEASNGASDYGNKFGEPAILGFTRSFGLRLPNGERREYLKPIMFTGGIGQMDHAHIEKGKPEPTMLVVKVGGPAYRIGLGGGAASSMVQGQNADQLDFNAVQRGDAEMEQKLNRAIRSCVECLDKNPIVSIHDQGAGGNANVLKEIVEPAGAVIEVRKIPSGDETLSVLELWGAEYQENDALLIKKDSADLFEKICNRENTPFSFVGEVTGTGKIVLHDSTDDSTPVDLELDHVLGKMPQKTFESAKFDLPASLTPLSLPKEVTSSISEPLDRVLRLLSVGSKRFLTNKVDRSVTGLIAQQQCVGPLHVPLSDYAVIAQSYFGKTGAATSIGEQPVKGLLDPAAMARLTVGEAMTNLAFAKVSGRECIKASGNWMWPAKLPGEGDAIYTACKAMRDVMIELGPAIDGGKDSLSMAAKTDEGETVKTPGTLVVSLYCTMDDITKKVTPDLKNAGKSSILFIDLGLGKNRMGGSALAQVYGQVGQSCPDLEDTESFRRAWDTVQQLIQKDLILAGHDRSDGGLLVTLLEMAFAGNCGLDIILPVGLSSVDSGVASQSEFVRSVLFPLFSEELGIALEVDDSHVNEVLKQFAAQSLPVVRLGRTTTNKNVTIRTADNTVVLEDSIATLRDTWEATSFQLEKLQSNLVTVEEEQKSLATRSGPKYSLTFTPQPTSDEVMTSTKKHKVAIIREEGSNGDREMSAAFHLAGFEVWDIAMKDLIHQRVALKDFRGVAFVGGFSYGDVLDSAKGWAAVIKFNPSVLKEFKDFYEREDTFSLGICNGCQLMALLGWVPFPNLPSTQQPRFIRNKSGRFESRFVTVKIEDSPSILFKGMHGSVLGVWSSHGEGRCYFPDDSVYQKVLSQKLVPARFVDDDSNATEKYPFNPNGSPLGISSLTSADGRHLAIMPHPDRTFLQWQWAYSPSSFSSGLSASPWMQMFQNARIWCDKQ